MCWSPVHKLSCLPITFNGICVHIDCIKCCALLPVCSFVRSFAIALVCYEQWTCKKWHLNHNERILITTTYHTVTFNFNIYHEFTAHVSYVTDDNVLISHSLYEKWHTLYTTVMCVLLVSFLRFHCYYDSALQYRRRRRSLSRSCCFIRIVRSIQ